METVSDTPVQSPTNLASSLRLKKNSAVGSLLRRGLTGNTNISQAVSSAQVASPTQTQPQSQSQDQIDVLEKVIAEVEIKQTQVEERPIQAEAQPLQPAPQPTPVGTPPTDPSVISQVLPKVVQEEIDQQPNALNPANAVGSSLSKEAVDSTALDQAVVDAARGVQQVEQEPSPEISPEVESYIKRVEDHSETAPQEIVIADGSQQAPTAQLPSQPVVVLPITPEIEKAGEKKSPKFSIRWLVEWSKKLMKAFTGKVIYRQEEATN